MKMAAVRAGAILVFLSVFPGSERVSGQRAPCYQCEDYKENHPQTRPYQQIRSHCSYPCECDEREPTCPPNVSIIRDGCGCCPICAGQLGQPCDGTSVCDDRKGLVCRYPYSGATVGICQATTGLPCMVSNRTYSHGETFQTDCRTQCSCQNGTYACSSLCPNENISPRGACTHPRLVEVPDQCCREWMCDSTEAEHPPVCKQQFTSWSTCSADCGLGISQRVSNLNQNCILQNETRICQLRPCEIGMLSLEQHARHRHIRKGHECKATQRVKGPVRLRFGPCRSKKRYRPKFCGSCDDKAGDGCCTPQLSTTIKVEFICNSIRSHDDPTDILLDLIEPGRDLWWPDDLLALGKQRSTQTSQIPFVSTDDELHGDFVNNWIKLSSDDAKAVKKHLETKSKLNYNSKILPVASNVDMHLFQNKDKLDEPLLDADVLIYEPGDNEKYYQKDNGNTASTVMITTPSGITESKMLTSAITIEETTKDAATSKPKKKRKKKPRKAFTSWLEFRDEEYQVDEYEDEDESHSNRKKRSLDGMNTNAGSDERDKRSSGSFREGYLDEVPDQNEEYEDEDENDEDEYSDEDEDDEEEDEDEDSTEEEEEEVNTTKRSRSRRKPVLYTFHRRKRDSMLGGVDSEKYSRPIPLSYSKRFSVEQGERGEKKEKAYSLVDKNSIDTDRIERIEEVRDNAIHDQRMERTNNRKTKPWKMKGKLSGEKWELNNQIPMQKLGGILSHERQGNSKIKRIPSGQNKVIKTQSIEGENSKTLQGKKKKVHKNRTKRHAPHPSWTAREGDESEDFSRGDHSVSFSVQWIIKCHCSRVCGVDTTAFPSDLNNIGEVILRRIHRTSPP